MYLMTRIVFLDKVKYLVCWAVTSHITILPKSSPVTTVSLLFIQHIALILHLSFEVSLWVKWLCLDFNLIPSNENSLAPPSSVEVASNWPLGDHFTPVILAFSPDPRQISITLGLILFVISVFSFKQSEIKSLIIKTHYIAHYL